MLSLVLAAAMAAPGTMNLLAGHFDEATMLANGATPQHSPAEEAKAYNAATKSGEEFIANLKKLHVDHPASLRTRRTPPTINGNFTTCSTCVAGGSYWNGVSCVTEDTGVAAFLVLGCFWGPGHETDCNKKCYFSITLDAGCGAEHNAACSTSSEEFGSSAMKLGLDSTIGASLGITGPNNGTYNGYFIYDAYMNATNMLDLFELSFSTVAFQNGFADVSDGPTTPFFGLIFAVVPVGSFSKLAAGTSSITMLNSVVVADAYFFYDNATCPNGITATGGCTAETMLTQSVTHSFAKADGWTFKATGPRTDTAVVSGSDAMLSLYTFCATPTSTSAAKLDGVCFRFTTLYVPFPTNWFAPSTGPTRAYGTYSCGTFNENITLFDYKADVQFDNVVYASATMRLGFRMLSASQTGGLSFASEESTEADAEVFSEGPVSIEMGTKLITSQFARATCSDTEVASAVKAASAGNLALTSSATGTTCGYSIWYNSVGAAKLETEGITKVGCVLASFVTWWQPPYILFDPTVSTNETAATAAFEAKDGAKNGAAHVASIGLVAMVGIVAANAAFVVGF
jgi:hypothetical protein